MSQHQEQILETEEHAINAEASPRRLDVVFSASHFLRAAIVGMCIFRAQDEIERWASSLAASQPFHTCCSIFSTCQHQALILLFMLVCMRPFPATHAFFTALIHSALRPNLQPVASSLTYTTKAVIAPTQCSTYSTAEGLSVHQLPETDPYSCCRYISSPQS